MFGKEKEPKVKKPSFMQKLKSKMDSLFESDRLTFLGKIFMLDLYATILSAIGIVVVSIIKSVTLVAFTLLGITPISVLSGATGFVWVTFILSFLAAIIIAFSEGYSLSENGESVLELKKKENN